MAITTFRLEIAMSAVPEVVYPILAEPEAQRGLQPLIVAVDERERGVDPQGRPYRVFDAVERFRVLGLFAWNNRIRVRVTHVEPGRHVAFQARSRPGIVVRSDFRLEPDGAQTRVVETCTVTMPFALKRFVAGAARRAQAGLLENLKARAEAAGAAAQAATSGSSSMGVA